MLNGIGTRASKSSLPAVSLVFLRRPCRLAKKFELKECVVRVSSARRCSWVALQCLHTGEDCRGDNNRSRGWSAFAIGFLDHNLTTSTVRLDLLPLLPVGSLLHLRLSEVGVPYEHWR